MKKWLKYTLYILLWAGVVAYISIATFMVRQSHRAQCIEAVAINIVDSSAVANLVTRSMVERWISDSKIRTVGEHRDSLRLAELEHYIQANGFVDKAKCYLSFQGELHVEISQLRPVLRVMLNGYNAYVTSDGFVFGRPPLSSRYTQVVTGSYTPLFRAGYSGYIEEVYKAGYQELEAEIRRAEVKNIFPLYAQKVKLREELREVNSRYTHRRLGENRKLFETRVDELRERNARDRVRISRELHELDLKIKREEQKQQVYVDKQKKLEKKHEDFINLITFVNVVENDKFWSSEIVQIVATESSAGDLRLELIPRSGDHTIIFGRIDEVQSKLDNARTFYKRVLASRGWQEFKSINVEYENQIVCK